MSSKILKSSMDEIEQGAYLNPFFSSVKDTNPKRENKQLDPEWIGKNVPKREEVVIGRGDANVEWVENNCQSRTSLIIILS